ncbi:MAG: hypothetical protein OFPII_19960 [Osedax symbiont Rs1]|nr:MAG: hypothetical protein OFPII_19960 [Osedax symbiont Rs1]
MHPCIKPIASAGIFLTAVESRACAMWCSEVTDSGSTHSEIDVYCTGLLGVAL